MDERISRLIDRVDWLLLLALFIIFLASLANLHSANSHAVGKQTVSWGLGFAVIGAIICLEQRALRRYSYLLYIVVVVLLLLTLAWGKIAGGSQRWLNFALFQLQTSEPAKIIMVCALARYFSSNEGTAPIGLKTLWVPSLLTAAPFVLVMMQPDLGTALMLAAIFCSMLAVVRIKVRVLLAMAAGAAVAIPVAWKVLLHDYQRRRIVTWIMHLFGNFNDAMGSGYQILQAKIAVGGGGSVGKGFLQGTQSHLHFLPERHTDFIFAVFAEEWGFIGCISLLCCYLFILLRGLSIATQAGDRFGQLVAFGAVMMLFWQVVVNLLMVLGFLPVVGIPLPFFSFGGSSLLTCCCAIGCICNTRFWAKRTD